MWGVKLPISSYFPNLISYTKHKHPFLKPFLVVVALGWTKHRQCFVPDLVNLVFQTFILLIQSASGRQPLNNWTVHVWRRRWCQFDYLIRWGASCLLVKSRQGFTELFFSPFTSLRKFSLRGANVKIFHYWLLFSPNRYQFLTQFSKQCCEDDEVIPDLYKSNALVSEYVAMTFEGITGHWCIKGLWCMSMSNCSGHTRDIFFTLLAIASICALQNDQMAVLYQTPFFTITQLLPGRSRNPNASPSMHDLKFFSAALSWAVVDVSLPVCSTYHSTHVAWRKTTCPASM